MTIKPTNSLKKSEEMFDFSIRSAMTDTIKIPAKTGMHTIDNKNARYSFESQKVTKIIPSRMISSL